MAKKQEVTYIIVCVLIFFFFIVSQCIPKKEIQPLSNLDIENRRF